MSSRDRDIRLVETKLATAIAAVHALEREVLRLRDNGGRARSRPTLAQMVSELRACGGNRSEACRRLGIARTTLWRRLRAVETRA